MKAAVKVKEPTMVRLGDIVEDTFYQIRTKSDMYSVKQYADCMKMGDVFPPMVLLPKSNKIISGFTRYAAYQRAFDPDYQVPVIYREFESDSKALQFAGAENRRNGQRLQKWDEKNLIQRLITMKTPVKEIADALGRPIDKVEILAGIAVTVTGTDKFEETKVSDLASKKAKMMAMAKVSGMNKPLKAGFGHLSGRTLTPESYNEMADHQPGWPTRMLANMLVGRIDKGLLNPDDKSEIEALKSLMEKLNQLFV